MTDRADLENRLRELENKIKEFKKRLPAHSVKPGLMMELIALEDERDSILAQLQQSDKKPPGK